MVLDEDEPLAAAVDARMIGRPGVQAVAVCVPYRLIERGARVTLQDAATLGLTDRVAAFLAGPAVPDPAEVTAAFWNACHGGRKECAALLLEHGADLNVAPSWEQPTPLDAAGREGADELVAWLRARGAVSVAAPAG